MRFIGEISRNQSGIAMILTGSTSKPAPFSMHNAAALRTKGETGLPYKTKSGVEAVVVSLIQISPLGVRQ